MIMFALCVMHVYERLFGLRATDLMSYGDGLRFGPGVTAHDEMPPSGPHV